MCWFLLFKYLALLLLALFLLFFEQSLTCIIIIIIMHDAPFRIIVLAQTHQIASTFSGHTTSCGQRPSQSWAVCWKKSYQLSPGALRKTESFSSSVWPCFLCATPKSSDSWRTPMTWWSTLRRDDLFIQLWKVWWGECWSWRMKWWRKSFQSTTTWMMCFMIWSSYLYVWFQDKTKLSFPSPTPGAT